MLFANAYLTESIVAVKGGCRETSGRLPAIVGRSPAKSQLRIPVIAVSDGDLPRDGSAVLAVVGRPLSKVMSPIAVILEPDDPPAVAVYCMVSRRLRHLAVVSDGTLVGYLSVRNILTYLNEELIGA